MRCVVTAGPTFEPLDQVRRLTNFSTGRLGSELATFLTSRGHKVTLLIGQQSTYRGDRQAERVDTFTTTVNLHDRLHALANESVDAVFHAAAVSDFSFGKVWRRSASGELSEANSGKISTREGNLLAELVPTPKIIAELRQWYPRAVLVGWKYEVEGGRDGVLRAAEKQIAECQTDACIVNGPAYGKAFGLVRKGGVLEPLNDAPALFAALEKLLQR